MHGWKVGNGNGQAISFSTVAAHSPPLSGLTLDASKGAARSAPWTSAASAASCAASAAAYVSSMALLGSIMSVRHTFVQYWSVKFRVWGLGFRV